MFNSNQNVVTKRVRKARRRIQTVPETRQKQFYGVLLTVRQVDR